MYLFKLCLLNSHIMFQNHNIFVVSFAYVKCFEVFTEYNTYKLEYGILDIGIKLDYGIQMWATVISST